MLIHSMLLATTGLTSIHWLHSYVNLFPSTSSIGIPGSATSSLDLKTGVPCKYAALPDTDTRQHQSLCMLITCRLVLKCLYADPHVPSPRAMLAGKLLGTALSVAGAVAQGLGLPADAFTSRMHHGPHLLAPTGSDLAQHGALGTVFAGYHYDLNFLTLHGQSRFPGLFVWLRDGQRVAVRIPPGCILIQAGKQMEWLTGGYVQAGMHEVRLFAMLVNCTLCLHTKCVLTRDTAYKLSSYASWHDHCQILPTQR